MAQQITPQPEVTTHYTTLPSFLGDVLVAGTEHGLRYISFLRGSAAIVPQPDWRNSAEPLAESVLGEAVRQLRAYFSGELRTFNLQLDPAGTEFQRRVWRELERIPYGETITYGELARRIGNPAASRAVGAANGQNPLPIVVPCHRVIGHNGKLTGFAGGLHLKEGLLSLEQPTHTPASGQQAIPLSA